MRILASMLFGFCVVSAVIALPPSALELPPTLQLASDAAVKVDELSLEFEDLDAETAGDERELKDLIRGLDVDRGNNPHRLDLELQSIEPPLHGEADERQRTTGREVMPSSHNESVGEKIRLLETVVFEEEEEEDGPTDALDDENAFDKGYFNDIDAEESRNRSALSYIEELRIPVTSIRIKLGSSGEDTPPNQAQRLVGTQASTWITASGATIPLPDRYTIGFAHRPLYYEELDLERCGLQHGCLQYEVSGFYFFWNTLVLPYRMATQCPNQLVCTRGDCQSCQYYPCELEPLQCSTRAIIAETAVLAGFTFLLL